MCQCLWLSVLRVAARPVHRIQRSRPLVGRHVPGAVYTVEVGLNPRVLGFKPRAYNLGTPDRIGLTLLTESAGAAVDEAVDEAKMSS